MKNVVMLLLLVAKLLLLLLLLLLAPRFIGGAEKRRGRGRGAWAWESPIHQAHRYNTYEIRT